MGSPKNFLFSSIIEYESVISDTPDLKPNLVHQSQQATKFSSPSKMPHPSPPVPDDQKRKKRRTKHDQIGRNFKCKHCNKSYLSHPALYTHRKTKHLLNPIPSRNKKVRKANELPEQNNLLNTLLKAIKRLNGQMGWQLENIEDHLLVKAMKQKAENTCDWGLAEYCKNMARLVNTDYLEKVCLVVLAYRECLNEYGWIKFTETRHEEIKCAESANNSPKIETILDSNEEWQKRAKKEYSANNDADRLPEIANEFMLLFIRKYEIGVEEQEIIKIVMNMCRWFYANKFTETQIVFID